MRERIRKALTHPAALTLAAAMAWLWAVPRP